MGMILIVTPNPCIDKTLFVESIVPKAKIKVEKVKEIAGGKGSNVSRVLHRLGVEVGHFIILGGHTGQRVKNLMELDGVLVYPAWISQLTRVVTTIVDRSWQQVAYFEPGPVIFPHEMDQVLLTFEKIIPSAELIVFCGSVSDQSAHDIYYRMIQIAKKNRIKTIIDSRGVPLIEALKTQPWIVKMNREEAEETWEKKISCGDDLNKFYEFLNNKGIEYLILTLGEKGAWFRGKGISWFGCPPKVNSINPVGSGDSFLAAFIFGLVNGKEWNECLRLGIASGAANAQIWEAAAITWDDIQLLLPEVEVESGNSFLENY
ncbi:1-phosphofructokinase family hexose kinase [Atribacter laminatus]|jgi:1-phosphofructokinase family hexose kinase|uniref:Tagatose-6-phosphate kinase n=1 Tax=Atribacter laminatus TaxID=2847778 RepID=A0A7T1AKF1_ATRLM|nr:1-phosphofructokinase family hexose kinase [Atribacter laminatus]QPM67554.1 Tagatose-6-phosphate kinase [Atribacter laminatus]